MTLTTSKPQSSPTLPLPTPAASPQGSKPPSLSLDARDALEEALALGCTRFILENGGWRRGLTLAVGAPRVGRLWHRHATLPPLRFTELSLNLCLWLSGDLAVLPEAEKNAAGPLACGDELILTLALEQVGRDQRRRALAHLAATQGALLPWLIAPAELLAQSPCELDSNQLSSWTSGCRSLILEALTPWLAAKLVDVEREKQASRSVEELLALGQTQMTLFESLLDAFARANRRDLAAFFLDAAAMILAGSEPLDDVARRYRGALDETAPLGERQRARRAGLALFFALEHIQGWRRELAATRVFDDDYETSQALLSDWEDRAGRCFARAALVRRRVESIDSPAG